MVWSSLNTEKTVKDQSTKTSRPGNTDDEESMDAWQLTACRGSVSYIHRSSGPCLPAYLPATDLPTYLPTSLQTYLPTHLPTHLPTATALLKKPLM